MEEVVKSEMEEVVKSEMEEVVRSCLIFSRIQFVSFGTAYLVTSAARHHLLINFKYELGKLYLSLI